MHGMSGEANSSHPSRLHSSERQRFMAARTKAERTKGERQPQKSHFRELDNFPSCESFQCVGKPNDGYRYSVKAGEDRTKSFRLDEIGAKCLLRARQSGTKGSKMCVI